VPREKLQILPVGVDVARFTMHAKPLPRDEGCDVVFLSVFQWSSRKGFLRLLLSVAVAPLPLPICVRRRCSCYASTVAG
jgi:hypothetical protein